MALPKVIFHTSSFSTEPILTAIVMKRGVFWEGRNRLAARACCQQGKGLGCSFITAIYQHAQGCHFQFSAMQCSIFNFPLIVHYSAILQTLEEEACCGSPHFRLISPDMAYLLLLQAMIVSKSNRLSAYSRLHNAARLLLPQMRMFKKPTKMILILLWMEGRAVSCLSCQAPPWNFCSHFSSNFKRD